MALRGRFRFRPAGRRNSAAKPPGPSASTARCLLVAVSLASCMPCARAFGEAQKYLIASSPRQSKITYLALPSSGAPATGGEQMRTLISFGLKFPQGLAVDQYRKVLYVADPNLGKLVGYDLTTSGKNLYAGKMRTVAKGVEVRSVAVDGLGNVFFTEEPKQLIMRVTARMMEQGITEPEVVYAASSVREVSAPGGIALDNYFVYWLNKAGGGQAGTLVRAPQEPKGNATGVVTLADNSMKCYGVCMAMNSLFYTDETNNLYGISRTATAQHNPVTISSALAQPRGCSHDGDGTVYVADKEHNAIYQFASNMQNLSPNRPLAKAVDLEGAFGLAVYIPVDK